jgi:hypothetical protein
MRKYNLRDPQLWIQSCLTVAGTVAISLAISGALFSPATLGEPSTTPTAVSPSQGLSSLGTNLVRGV